MAEYASKGIGAAGLTTGIVGSALGALNSGLLNGNGLLGGILGGNGGMNYGGYAPWMIPSENIGVNRYEASQAAKIAELEGEVKFRDSNIYTDQKMLEMYKYFDSELRGVRDTLGAQAVMNQKTADSFDMVRTDIGCVKNELYSAISRERDERCCGDNSIVTYMNATFYPRMTANVETGTDVTAQAIYNPVMNCGCGYGCK